MILVDSSVWIDYFRGGATPQADRLDSLLGSRADRHRRPDPGGGARKASSATMISAERRSCDFAPHGRSRRTRNRHQAAKNFRTLRSLGVTVRKTIDTVIATRCIESRVRAPVQRQGFRPVRGNTLGLRPAA
ncbi:MAG: VapC toxin family PIN domain ribonuclease [Comamonadaceae bacterium]|nr:VapC toxin family PIN domain ribonuclease [Comamonadaceae bacterium]